jgi:replicative DNA helicase
MAVPAGIRPGIVVLPERVPPEGERKRKMKTSKELGSSTSVFVDLKDRVDTHELLEKLDLINSLNLKPSADEMKGNCPTGHASQSQTCFSINVQNGLYYCFNCGTRGDIIELVTLVKNKSTWEAGRWLAEQFAQELLPRFDAAEEDLSPKQKTYRDRGILYEKVFEHGHQQLFESIGQEPLAYLTTVRGYDAAVLKNTEWFLIDWDVEIRNYLRTVLPKMEEQIAKLDLQGASGDHFRLGIPYRDRHGVILGYAKRAHIKAGFDLDGGTGVRWDSTKGLEKVDLFGLNRLRKAEELIVGEGYPDAVYLPALGVKNIVALGQGLLSEKHVAQFEAEGVKRLILALDNDGGTGITNSEKACKLLANSDIKVFVIDPLAMGKSKDPDEYVTATGVVAFKNLVRNAESAPKWMCNRILAKQDLQSDLGRDKAISEALEYADSVSTPRDSDVILDQLSTTLGITDDLLQEEFKRVQQRKASERLRVGIEEGSRQAKRLIEEGDAEKAVKHLQENIAILQSEYYRASEPARENLDDFLDDKRNRDGDRNAVDRIGYKLVDFAEVDNAIKGVQGGLYIIAADPNIGKTAFMVSLMIDLLRSNDDVSCLFYSMDDSRDMIVSRMLAHLTDMRINEVRFKQTDPEKQTLLDAAYKLLTDWYHQGRLDIREGTAHLTMSRVQNEIRQHEHRGKLVVLIDGIYNLPVDTERDSIRVENIERAHQLKQLVRWFNIPVIATAEFRKQGRDESSKGKKERDIHDIMETGKYGYNADLIILLSPKYPDTYGDQDEPIIKADFGKNKLESFRGTMEFKFIRAKSVMQYVSGSKII